MHLLHRTIPFIAVAALVTVSPAGAQEREDSTSSASAVASLLGLGGNFVGFGGSDNEASHPNAWNCAGGCAAFGARGFSKAPFGATVPALRASSRGTSVAAVRSVLLPTDRADLSDYGWSRRVGTDGAALERLSAATAPWGAPEVSTSVDEPAGTVLAPVSDGAGRAPAWVAPGSSPVASAAAGWNEATVESAAPAADAATQASGRVSTPVVAGASDTATPARSASAFDVAPLVTTVPEPSTIALMAVGLSSLLFLRRRSARGR